MILRKPYAFLIKHFRAIHLAITLLLIFNATRLVKVVSFFNNYVRNGYTTSAVVGLNKTYIPFTIYIFIFLTLILIGAMFILMIQKNKPSRLYIITFVYYLTVFIALFYLSSVLKSFEDTLLAATSARTIRDILLIGYIPQIVFIAFYAIRSVGFDFKKFDFTSDLRQMDYSLQDAEEFELNINLEGYKARQKFNRFIREFVYYIKENKFIVICISVVLIFIFIYLIYNNTYSNFDSNYGMKSTFTFNKLNFSFDDAIVTNLNYNGKVICEDCYYVVIKTHASNFTGEPVTIDYKNIKLEVNNKNLNPILNNGSLFVDFADQAPSITFPQGVDRVFTLAYKINKGDLNKSKRIVIFNGNAYQKGEQIDKHIFVNIKAKNMSKVEIEGNYDVNTEVVFSNSLLNNTKLKIEDYHIEGTSYKYKNEKCVGQNCSNLTDMVTVPINSSGKVLLILDTELQLDKKVTYYASNRNIADFANKFVHIQYRVDGEVISDDSKNVTPQNAEDFMAFIVSNKISKSDIIQCIITIRDKKYIVNLKK